MLNVSQAVKNAYANPSSAKTLVIYFPELQITVDSSTIYSESFTLSESIMDSDSIEFVGCNPSKMQVQIQDFGYDVKGKRVQVSVYTSTTQNEPVPLFDGIVDEVTQQSNKRIKQLTAYDLLYTKGNTDIAQWYISKFSGDWAQGTNLKDFRDELFEYLNIDVVTTTLINDTIEFVKEYSPVNMKALDIIKYICQINGVFGIINRQNKFEFRTIQPLSSATPVSVGYYKQIDYQEFSVRPINKLTIRQDDQEEGVSSGTGSNIYIVQGNFFAYHLEDEDLQDIADTLYPQVSGISYIPYKVTQTGYPWLECGDAVQYQVYDFEASQEQGEDVYTTKTFYIFERYLKGIQAFRDQYEARGEEEQSVFVTNINAKIDTIKDQIEAVVGKLNSLSLKYVMFYNETAIDITDGETKAIASNEFAVSQASQVRIELEYLIECTTTETETNDYVINNDLKVKVLYEYDGTFLDSRQPIETFQDGKHILHNYYVINIPDQQAHFWRVFLECEGGSVHIDIMQAQNTIFGLGTLVGDLWDGTIRVDDTAYPLRLHNGIASTNFSESVSSEFITPDENTFNETVNGLRIRFRSIGSFTDSISFNEIVERWIIDTTTPTTSNPNFVKKSAGKFEMQTEYQYNGTELTIDSGCLFKVVVDTDDFATLNSLEII